MSAARQRGFALLITLTLLAFIVLLLVGLATYTRIETAIAGNTQRQAQARENALLALNVALGQLQKHAGPDQRMTATAEALPNRAGTTRYTGVWPSDPTADPDGDPLTPLSWLVSGNEGFNAQGVAQPLAVTPTTALTATSANPNAIALVSTNTSRTANDVLARLMPITAPGVPGAAASATPTIGRYAWWVGDQGVKAPVAVQDASAAVTYAPYDSPEMAARLRQQIALNAPATDDSAITVLDSRDPSNAQLVRDAKVSATSQISFLNRRSSSSPSTPATGNNPAGLATVQQRFHDWSPNNLAVLADGRAGGLRRDLSLKPDLLGPEFAAWADYGSYMEVPSPTAAPGETTTVIVDPDAGFPAILPPYSATSPIRRRYRVRGETAPYRVAPVLSFFGLSFSLRNNASSAATAIEVSARCVVGLWNPYTSALVPEDLQIVVKGLPDHIRVFESITGIHRHVNLAGVMRDQAGGGDMKLFLPFTADGTHEDRSSWLPGRVYNWSAESNTADPSDGKGKPMLFYERAAAQSGSGIVRVAPGPPLPESTTGSPGNRWCDNNSTTALTIELRLAASGEKLAEFQAPLFSDFETDRTRLDINDKLLDFAFVFRLPDLNEIPLNQAAPWLQAAGRDPREAAFPVGGYVGPGFAVDSNGLISPALLVQTRTTTFDASYPDRPLDRDPTSGSSYNEDVPVFELPRAPILSLGSLQHMFVAGARPFAMGNSWGGLPANTAFDRFFFSGLTNGTGWRDVVQPLPNPLLRVLTRKVDGSPVTAADVSGQADGFSSIHLMQHGAFNLNSTSKVAWAAVLRSVRFSAATAMTMLDADPATGTAADVAATLQPQAYADQSVGALFARFAQSAQEVFKADDGYQQSAFGGNGPVVETPLYRRGIRTFTESEIASLAGSIAGLVQQKHRDSGPFRSMAEFLSPSALFTDSNGGQVSLIEKAIDEVGLNTGKIFSSQFLTQADIMTALAPVLFPRSDTFLIRTYGEAVNPATGATEGRAWCEATVQRVPEYFDPSTNTGDAAEILPAALTSTLNQQLGRRFKVVSFRWLTRSDI